MVPAVSLKVVAVKISLPTGALIESVQDVPVATVAQLGFVGPTTRLKGPWVAAFETTVPLELTRVNEIDSLLGEMYFGPRSALVVFLVGIRMVSDIGSVGPAVDPLDGVDELTGVLPEPPGARLLPPPPPPHAVTSPTIAMANIRTSCFLINRATRPMD